MGDTGGLGARVGIVANMLEPTQHREPEPDGATRAPEPPDRPSDHAQWDEVQACWTEWDVDAKAWVRVGPPPPAVDDQRAGA